MLMIAGLSLTVVAWIIQLFKIIVKKDHRLNRGFLAVYAIGCILLAVGSLQANDITGGLLNVFDLILVAAILLVLLLARKKAV